MDDFVLSPAYDLHNTKLHLPTESSTALDLFADDFETEAFRQNGFYSGADFLELADRFGMKAGRAVSTLRLIESFPDKAQALVTASMLSDEAKSNYVAIVRERAQAIRMGA